VRARRIGTVALVASMATAATVQAAPSDERQFAPPAVKVRATNGFDVYLFATSPRNRTSDSVTLLALKGGARVVYQARGEVGRNFIRARFGKIGFGSFRFDPKGPVKNLVQPGGCERVATRVGTFDGELEFEGEHGYASASASTGSATAHPLRVGSCDNSAGYYPDAGSLSGERTVSKRNGVKQDSIMFQVLKRSPEATTSLFAYSVRVVRGLSVFRQVRRTAPPSALTYSESSMTLSPPAPFSGVANVSIEQKPCETTAIPSGSLRVSLPGQPGVSLIGPAFDYAAYVPRPPPPPGPPGPPCAL
jgi:hypothetical protein